jgi:hypothetical protein
MKAIPSILAVALALAVLPANGTAQERIPQLKATRDLRLDGEEHNLVPVDAIAIGPNGEIAVHQLQEMQVRIYSSAGKLLRKVGGRGSGPGEFTHITRSGWYRDSLWVYDGLQRRTTVFSSSGTPQTTPIASIRNENSAKFGSLPETGRAALLALYPDRSWYAAMSAAANGTTAADSIRMVHLRIGADGSIRNLVADTKVANDVISLQSGSRTISPRVPFPLNPQPFELAPDGSRVVFPIVTSELLGQRRFRLLAVNPDGSKIFDRTYNFAPVRISPHVADSVVSERSDALAKRGPELAAQYRKQVKSPDVYPPVGAVLVGRDGTVVIKLAGTTPSNYTVFSAKGDRIGAFSLPQNVTLMAAEKGTVWGIELDADDVPSIVRYKLTGY